MTHRLSPGYGEQGLLFIVVPRLLTAVASLGQHGLRHGLSSCGTQA